MTLILDEDELEAIARRAWFHRGFIVGIDGFAGAGKTTLATSLTRRLKGFRVGLDCYVQKKGACNYVARLRLNDLSHDLTNLRAAFDFVVIDGICLLDALDAINVSPGMHIYVKRISPAGLCHDEFNLEEFNDDDRSLHWLDKNIFDYHISRHPDRVASHLYRRIET